MKTDAAKLEIDLHAETDPSSLEVTADPHLLDQLLINLVKSATRVLSDQKNGKILLKGRFDKTGRVIIEIRDNGPGIKKSQFRENFYSFLLGWRQWKTEGFRYWFKPVKTNHKNA